MYVEIKTHTQQNKCCDVLKDIAQGKGNSCQYKDRHPGKRIARV